LVNPPVPVMVAVKLSAPVADDVLTLSTWATTSLPNTVATEMVLLPVPGPAGMLIVAGPEAAAKVRGPPVPVATVWVKAFATSLLNVIEATVWGPSSVTDRLPVWAGLLAVAPLLNTALNVLPFGTVAGFQLAAVFQLPPAGRFQVMTWARAAGPAAKIRPPAATAAAARRTTRMGCGLLHPGE